MKNTAEEMVAESLAVRAMSFAKPMPEPVGGINHVLLNKGAD